MGATCDVGNSKLVFIQQDAKERKSYTILASTIFPTGFTVTNCSVTVQVTDGASTIAIQKGASTILSTANISTGSAGYFNPPLVATPSGRIFSGSDVLTIVTAGGNDAQSLVVLEVCEENPRDVSVTTT